jgi:hypothetical protein
MSKQTMQFHTPLAPLGERGEGEGVKTRGAKTVSDPRRTAVALRYHA